MQILVKQKSGATIVELVDDIDLNVVHEVRKELLEQVNQQSRVFVDLSGVTIIDSSGVACLIEAYQLSRQLEKTFGLIAVSENVGRVLSLAHLNSIFPQFRTVDEAVNS